MNSDDVGRQEVNRLAQHRRFGFNTTNAPPDNAQTIDHRRMGVGADERLRKINRLLPNVLREIFEIDLVADADARRNYAKTIKRLRAPLEKLVTRTVAFELHLHVFLKRIARARKINLDRVVDNQIDWHERFDDARILV